MNVNGIASNKVSADFIQGNKNKTIASTSKDSATAKNNSGVIYETESQSTKTTTKSMKYADPDLVAKLKKEAEERTSQLKSLVEKTILKQSSTYSSVWEALASGTLTFDEETINQAKEDISEDGYWGVEQTSERIISFAKALTGDSPEMIEKMRTAFETGYKQATNTWGQDLPDLSSDTYGAVMKKFDEWANESDSETTQE